MTSMTPASLLADLLPAAPASASADGEASQRFAIDDSGLPQAADFAALLQRAGLAVPPLVADEESTVPGEALVDDVAADAASASPVDSLLFLAVVQAPSTASGPAASSIVSPLAARQGTPMAGVDHRAGADHAADAATMLDADALPESTTIGASTPGKPSVRSRSTDPLTASLATTDSHAGERAPVRNAGELHLVAAQAMAAAVQPQHAQPHASPLDREAPTTTAASVEPTATFSPAPATANAAPVSVVLETPLHDPSWRTEAATRVASLVTRGIEHAELRVTPPELGPVELRIDVRGGEASLVIVAAQATTRDALEQALPMLRDMLAQQGLSLGQATVADGRADSQQGGFAAPRSDAFAGTSPIEDLDSARSARPAVARGLIDVFA